MSLMSIHKVPSVRTALWVWGWRHLRSFSAAGSSRPNCRDTVHRVQPVHTLLWGCLPWREWRHLGFCAATASPTPTCRASVQLVCTAFWCCPLRREWLSLGQPTPRSYNAKYFPLFRLSIPEPHSPVFINMLHYERLARTWVREHRLHTVNQYLPLLSQLSSRNWLTLPHLASGGLSTEAPLRRLNF